MSYQMYGKFTADEAWTYHQTLRDYDLRGFFEKYDIPRDEVFAHYRVEGAFELLCPKRNVDKDFKQMEQDQMRFESEDDDHYEELYELFLEVSWEEEYDMFVQEQDRLHYKYEDTQKPMESIAELTKGARYTRRKTKRLKDYQTCKWFTGGSTAWWELKEFYNKHYKAMPILETAKEERAAKAAEWQLSIGYDPDRYDWWNEDPWFYGEIGYDWLVKEEWRDELYSDGDVKFFEFNWLIKEEWG